MARERLVIELKETGSRQVVRGFRDVKKEAGTADKVMASAKRTLVGFGVAVGGAAIARGIFEQGRAFQNLQRRVAAVSKDSRELESNLDRLTQVSNETGSSLANNAAAFQRFSIATQELNLSSKETIDILGTLNKVFAVGGSSAQEQASALLQLSQALASGRLQGEEFRAVSESAPLLLQAIVKSTGFTRGELKKLASEGKITSEVIIDAIRESSDEFDQRFRELPPSFDQSVQRLKNSMLQLGEALVPVVEKLGEFVEGAAKVAASVARVLSNDINPAVRANARNNTQDRRRSDVVGLIQRQSGISDDRASSLNDLLKQAEINSIGGPGATGDLERIIGQVGGINNLTSEAVKAIESIAQSRIAAIEAVRSGLFQLLASEGPTDGVFGEELDRILDLEGTGKRIEAVTGIIQRFKQGIASPVEVDFAKQLLGQVDEVVEERAAIEERGLQIPLALAAGITKGAQFLKDSVAEGLSEAAKAVENFRNASAGSRILQDLREEAELLRVTAGERQALLAIKRAEKEIGVEISDAKREEILAQARSNEEEQRRIELIREAKQTDIAENIRLINDLRAEGLISQEEANRLLAEQNKLLEEGAVASEGFRVNYEKVADETLTKMAASLNNVSSQAAGAFVRAINSAEDAVADFVLSGFEDLDSFQDAFAQFARQLAKDILKLLLRLLLLKLLEQGLSSGSGGGGSPGAGAGASLGVGLGGRLGDILGSGGFDASGFAQNGGFREANQATVVGEFGRPELFVPSVPGRIFPANQVGTGGGGANVTIIQASDEQAVLDAMASDNGEAILLGAAQRRADEFKAILGIG